MMTPNKTDPYSALLNIRLGAGRRNLFIQGGIFIVSFIGLIVFGLLGKMNERSLYLTVAVLVPVGIGCLTTWVRLEITKGMIALIEHQN